MATRQEIIDYITQAAEKRGIDPAIVLKVVQQESGFNPAAANDKTPREKSYGLFQLNIQGGLGVHARQKGIEPTDPKQWKQQVDFSLDTIKRDGWRQWGGARDTGVGRWTGINNRSFNPTNMRPPKNIDIGDEPKLEQLTSSNSSTRAKSQPPISLSQLAPTEADNTMARHPSYDQAIREAMAQVNSGDLRNQVQMAGMVLPAVRGPKGRMAKNPMNPALKHDRLPPPEKVPGPRTPTVEQQEKAAREAHTEREAQKARVLRGENPSPDTGSGPAIPLPGSTAPITPKKVPTTSYPINKATTGATTAAAGTAALNAKNDPAVEAVQRQIQGPSADPPLDDSGGAAQAQQPHGPQPATPSQAAASVAANAPYNPTAPSGGPGDVTGPLVEVAKEAVKDPKVRDAVKVVAGGMVKAKARKDALAADMANNPTYYQQRAAMAQGGGGDPLSDRAMERAVMMDNERVMRGQVRGTSPRGMNTPQQPRDIRPAAQRQPASQPNVRARPPVVAKDQSKVPTTEEQIIQQVLGGEHAGSQAQRFPPSGPPSPQGRVTVRQGPEMYHPLMSPDVMHRQPEATMPSMQPPPQMTPQMTDPIMMELMNYFTPSSGQ